MSLNFLTFTMECSISSDAEQKFLYVFSRLVQYAATSFLRHYVFVPGRHSDVRLNCLLFSIITYLQFLNTIPIVRQESIYQPFVSLKFIIKMSRCYLVDCHIGCLLPSHFALISIVIYQNVSFCISFEE